MSTGLVDLRWIFIRAAADSCQHYVCDDDDGELNPFAIFFQAKLFKQLQTNQAQLPLLQHLVLPE
jgi:hypothetical protein